MLENLTSKQPQETSSLAEGFKGQDYFNKSPLCKKIHALLECDGFQSDINWIAARLNERKETVSTALMVLEQMKVIQWVDGKIVDNFKKLITRSDSKKCLIDRHRISSLEILSNLDPDNRFTTYNGYQAFDEDRFWELNDKLCALQTWIHEVGPTSGKTILLGYSFTGTNVIPNKKGEL